MNQIHGLLVVYHDLVFEYRYPSTADSFNGQWLNLQGIGVYVSVYVRVYVSVYVRVCVFVHAYD